MLISAFRIPVFFGLIVASAMGQDSAPEPVPAVEPIAAADLVLPPAPNLAGAVVGAAAGPILREGQSPFIWGPLSLRPFATYQYLYAAGLLAGPGQPTDSSIQTFSPGLFVELGKLWTFTYSPTWTFYSSPLFPNSLSQDAKLMGSTGHEAWRLQFSQEYTRTAQVLIATGTETPQQEFSTAGTFAYDFNDHVGFSLGLTQDIRISSEVPASREWTVPASVHYAVVRGLEMSFGPTIGYVTVNPGFNMAYVRLEGTLSWKVVERLSLNLTGGWEGRKIDGSGGQVIDSGIYSGSAIYVVREGTTLTASASRDLEVSYSVNDINQTTQMNLGVQQRLLRHFYLSLGAGSEKVAYLAIGDNLSTVRSDRFTTQTASLSTTLFGRISLTLEYSRARNLSDATGYGFSSTQTGFVASYSY
jgi:hypothetical protein